jgi:parallel beta-helix repeat protein
MHKAISMSRRVLLSVLLGFLLTMSFVAFVGKSAMAAGNNNIAVSEAKTTAAADFANTTVSEAKAMIDSNPSLVVLDVRNQSEYYTGHIRNAKLIPVAELAVRLVELNATDEILVYCLAGGRSTTASQILVGNGFLHIYNMLGGITSWVSEGYPVYVKYSSIQEAINSVAEGSTVLVSSGLYEEHLTINKSIALIGENKDTTIVDGTSNGTVFYVRADNVSISNFKIQYSGCSCQGYCGIYVESHHQNINITGNNLFFNGFGIKVEWTQGVVIAHNDITSNLDYCIIVSNSSTVLTFENYLAGNMGGIRIGNTTALIVSSNIVFNSLYGLDVLDSDNNSFVGNTFSLNNIHGIYLNESNDNLILHNNFMNNRNHAVSRNSTNIWDNALEGNYWDNFTGVDANLDGIGDTPQAIDANNTDNYPLMGVFSSFNTSAGKYVNVVSNSTIEDFAYFESNSTIRMHVSNMTANQTYGFCRICIPYALINETIYVNINGVSPTYSNYSLYDNGTHRWIYFAYEHSRVEIIIVPEFPSSAVLLLLMMATPVAVTICRRKKSSGLRKPQPSSDTSCHHHFRERIS